MKPADAEIARILRREGLVRVPKRERHGKPEVYRPDFATVDQMKARYLKRANFRDLTKQREKGDTNGKLCCERGNVKRGLPDDDRMMVDPATGKRVIVNAAGKVIGRQG